MTAGDDRPRAGKADPEPVYPQPGDHPHANVGRDTRYHTRRSRPGAEMSAGGRVTRRDPTGSDTPNRGDHGSARPGVAGGSKHK